MCWTTTCKVRYFFMDNIGLRTAGVLFVVCVVWECCMCTVKYSWVCFDCSLAFIIDAMVVVCLLFRLFLMLLCKCWHWCSGKTTCVLTQYTGWVTVHVQSGPKNTAHGFHYNNFVYSQSLFIIISPPNTVCVTTLPCNISNHSFIHVHFYTLFRKC